MPSDLHWSEVTVPSNYLETPTELPNCLLMNPIDYCFLSGNRFPLHRKKRISKKWWAKLEKARNERMAKRQA